MEPPQEVLHSNSFLSRFERKTGRGISGHTTIQESSASQRVSAHEALPRWESRLCKNKINQSAPSCERANARILRKEKRNHFNEAKARPSRAQVCRTVQG